MQLCPTASTLNAEPDGADSGATGASLPPPPLLGKPTLESFLYNLGLLLRNTISWRAELRTVLNCATYFFMLDRNSH